jgi:L-aminopeptidase/D-esterase-like protein
MSKTLCFDFPDFSLGCAEDESGPTGCTVLRFQKSALAACDVRGGSVAARETTLLDSLSASAWIDALCFAGGSTYGLEAASGVMRELLRERAQSTRFQDIPSVPAAVVYDFAGRDNAVFPGVELGRQALGLAKTGECPIGARGAGRNVSVGKFLGRKDAEPSGQGAAFLELPEARLFCISIVNALGSIYSREGKLIAGSKTLRLRGTSLSAELLKRSLADAPSNGNTTLTAIITDLKLDRLQLQRLAATAHTAMAEVIRPFHTTSDGDILFAISTESRPKPQHFSIDTLSVHASRVAQDAVLSTFSEVQNPS